MLAFRGWVILIVVSIAANAQSPSADHSPARRYHDSEKEQAVLLTEVRSANEETLLL